MERFESRSGRPTRELEGVDYSMSKTILDLLNIVQLRD